MTSILLSTSLWDQNNCAGWAGVWKWAAAPDAGKKKNKLKKITTALPRGEQWGEWSYSEGRLMTWGSELQGSGTRSQQDQPWGQSQSTHRKKTGSKKTGVNYKTGGQENPAILMIEVRIYLLLHIFTNTLPAWHVTGITSTTARMS